MTRGRLESSGSPKGWLRLLVRLPVALYRMRLGFLFGRRFLMVEHRGRRSGRIRRTVLEVVANHPEAVFVVAAWGKSANWLKNVRAEPRVRVHIGFQRFETEARVVDEEAGGQILGEYAANHERAFRKLARLVLIEPGSTPAESVERMAETVPVVELPRRRAAGRRPPRQRLDS